MENIAAEEEANAPHYCGKQDHEHRLTCSEAHKLVKGPFLIKISDVARQIPIRKEGRQVAVDFEPVDSARLKRVIETIGSLDL